MGKSSGNSIHIPSVLPSGHILPRAQEVGGMAAWLEESTQQIIISEPVHLHLVITG